MDQVRIILNGEDMEVAADRNWTLLFVLREVLGLTGTKCGCNTGDCGACKVIIDGQAKNSCLIKFGTLEGKHIETIEGLSRGGELHPLQRAFIDCGAIQCGFCTPGMIMTAKALLDHNPNPSEDEIREAISVNLCRCTGYVRIVEAIKYAAELLTKEALENG